MRWGTAVGAWGDSFVACGTAKAAMNRMGEREFGLVHYGFDAHISAFLRLQEGVAEVRHVTPQSREQYTWWVHRMMCYPHHLLPDYAEELLRGTDIAPECVLRTHVYHLNYDQPVHRWHSPVLPASSREWAQQFLREEVGGPFLMLHPYSVQSIGVEGHWPWWRQAIQWLCEVAPDFGLKIVWTGTNNPLDIQHPAIVNAIKRTPSMLEVFALQQLAALTIATSNGVAHWSVMDRTPAIICCNAHMKPDDPLPGGHIFKQWISVPPVVQVEYRDKLEVFQHQVCTALSEVGL
jgi:hypothetical protein